MIDWIKQYVAVIKNYPRLVLLSALLVLPTLLDFFSVISGIKEMTLVCYFLFMCLAIPIEVKNMSVKDLCLYALFVIVVILNYLIFPESQQYITDVSFMLCMLLYIPVSIFVVRKINEWDAFLYVFFPLAVFAICMNAYICFFSDIDLYGDNVAFNYMELSYAVLPAVCGTYAYFRETRNLLSLVFTFLGLASVFNFGSRAVVLYVITFIFASELFTNRRLSIGKIVTLVLLIVGYLNIGSLMTSLANSGLFSDSRFLTKFVSNELFNHETREYIYSACRARMSTMGLEISGLFGDRPYCAGAAYPHNIFYEVIMSFGWIFGIIFLCYLFIVMYKSLVKGASSIIFFLFFFSVFCRFFVSGSYIIEGRFWLMLFVFISLYKKQQKISRIDYENITHIQSIS